MMVPVFLLLLAAVPVFAVPDGKELVQYRHYREVDRIIGGVPANIEEFPFLAALIYTVIYEDTIFITGLCGGTILTEDWVLTSARCAQADPRGMKMQLSHVRAGSSYTDRGGVIRRIMQTVSHENPPHNIALIKVDEPWPLNGVTINLGRLPRQDDPIPVGSPATIMGWGSTDFQGTPADVLMKVEVLVISVDSCNRRWLSWSENKYGVTDSYICTTYDPTKTPSSAFENDIGGPVVVNGQVVGIVSVFDDEKPTSAPNIHTRVSLYIDWIEENVGPLPSAK